MHDVSLAQKYYFISLIYIYNSNKVIFISYFCFYDFLLYLIQHVFKTGLTHIGLLLEKRQKTPRIVLEKWKIMAIFVLEKWKCYAEKEN